MRKSTIACDTIEQVKAACPWAVAFLPTATGWMAFESAEECKAWQRHYVCAWQNSCPVCEPDCPKFAEIDDDPVEWKEQQNAENPRNG